jgi:hypothetical protein
MTNFNKTKRMNIYQSIRVGVASLSCIFLLLSCDNQTASVSKQETIASNSTDKSFLSSWSDSSRKELLDWIRSATDSTSPSFIPVVDRIAVFDNDGTLWPEQPVPTQLVFAMEQLREKAKKDPKVLKNPVIKGALEGDMGVLKKSGMKGLFEILEASHTGMSEDSFNVAVRKWIDTAIDPKFNKRYKEVVYAPMVELIDCLKQHQFTVFIVSGGGADFMREWSNEVYGIPSHQVIGSYGEAKFELVNGKPVLSKAPGAIYIDDKVGKPVAIHRFIGKVPVFCGGNSDGDLAMMQYTASSPYRSKIVLLHHTDSLREYAYDVKTLSGHLEKALVEAREKKWMIVDMKTDFKNIFSFQNSK